MKQNEALGEQIRSVNLKESKYLKMCSVTLDKFNVNALLDTGADVTLMSANIFSRIPKTSKGKLQTMSNFRLVSVTGQDLKILGKSSVKFKLGNKQMSFPFIVVSHIKNPIIFGSDFLCATNARWDFSKKTISVGSTIVPLQDKRERQAKLVRCAQSIMIPPSSSVVIPCSLPKKSIGEYILTPLDNSKLFRDQPGLLSPNILASFENVAIIVKNDTQRLFHCRKNQVVAVAEQVDCPSIEEVSISSSTRSVPSTNKTQTKIDLSKVPSSFRGEFQQLMDEYADLFAETDLQLGRTGQVKMTIDTGDHQPIRQKPYRTPFSERPKIDKALDDMIKAEIIRPSTSPWASPIVIVPKKDGSRRMCIDYRKINQITHKNSYPLPNISEMLSSFKDARFFSSLDLKSGYWQIEMEEKDKEKTAFTCHRGLFEFNVLPFGLTSAPPVFQNLMDGVLAGTLGIFTCVYLDDILIYSSSIEEHLQHLKIVFERLRKAALKLKPTKCHFVLDEVNFLGHQVSANGIQPDPEKIKVIRNLKAPKTVREVRSFIGMCSYYRRFIDHFSDIAEPLTQLTRKNAKFLWSDKCQTAFDKLKVALCEAPILAHPDLSKPYKLYTDASLKAVGAVLTQECSDGERVVQYVSKQLSPGQQKWATIEREAYAIVYAVNKLRQYLLGTKFTVYTDHKPLRSLFTAEMKNARIQRWAIMLSEYGCDIEYQSGKLNVPADVLSRLAYDDTEDVVIIDSSEPTQKPEAVTENALSDKTTEEHDSLTSLMTDLRQDQRDDEFLSQIVHELEQGESLVDYVVDEGILYHISTPVKRDTQPCMQVAIPQKHVPSILYHMHESEFGGGHASTEKTYSKVRRRYHWPNMYRDVAKYVNDCGLCKARRLKRERAPMQDMPIPSYPFEMIGIDTCGPFPETANGNKYIITLIDHLSAWPEAFAVKDKCAETVARLLLQEIIPRHSCPRVILSDRGTEFVNAVIAILTEKMRVTHLKSSPYHPQTNGKIERFHRFMNDLLSKYTYKTPLEWDSYLPAMLMTYRTAVQESTQHTPFLMLYGRDPVLPIDTLLQPKLRYLGDAYVPTILQRLHEVHLDAKEHLKYSREKNKDRIEQKAILKQFSPGDAVFYFNRTYAPGESTKLKLKWQPFYRIIEQKSPVNYAIKHQQTGVVKIVHVDDLQMANPDNKWEKFWETHGTYDSKQKSLQEDDSPSILPKEPTRRQPIRATRLSAPLDPAKPPVAVSFPDRLVADSPPPSKPDSSADGSSQDMEQDKPIHLRLKRRPGSPELWDVIGKKPRYEDLPDDNMDLEISSVSLEHKCPPPEIAGSANKWFLDLRWRKVRDSIYNILSPY